MFAALVVLFLMAESAQGQYSVPEGPDGLVYKEGYHRTRYATSRKGRWDAWQFKGYPGNGGQRVTLTAAELAQVEGHLKRIASILESTPYAQAQIGWYAVRSIGWINTRLPRPGVPLNRLPVMSYYTLYPFNMTDIKKTVNGVEQWVPDWSHETTSIQYSINPSIPGPSSALIFRKDHEDGSTTRFYADPQPGTYFKEYPVFDGSLVISRKGRPLFRHVSVEQALVHFLPLYRQDRDSAEARLADARKRLAETESPAFAKEALDDFEKEYGAYKTTRPRDYEMRLKVRNQWIERMREEARAAASPPRPGPEGAWYWEPVRAYAEMEQLSKSAEVKKPACFEPSKAEALYSTKGLIRVDGSTPSCKSIMEADPGYFDLTLPRTAPQLLVVGNVSRCFDTQKNPPQLLPMNQLIPDGCVVHAKIWEQMDWKALSAIVAP